MIWLPLICFLKGVEGEKVTIAASSKKRARSLLNVNFIIGKGSLITDALVGSTAVKINLSSIGDRLPRLINSTNSAKKAKETIISSLRLVNKFSIVFILSNTHRFYVATYPPHKECRNSCDFGYSSFPT